MDGAKILIVDDEEDIRELVGYNLQRAGYRIAFAVSGEEVLLKAGSMLPDLILLDLMLPGIDGLEVARRLKTDKKTASVPIIMLTAKGEEVDVVKGLELGADDYIVKPFSPRVLSARVKAVIRRHAGQSREGDSVIMIHGLMIHSGTREVLADGQKIELTFSEFQLLHFLAGRPGWVFTRSQIVDAVRGSDYYVTDRSVDVQVVGLRKKLGVYGTCIETVRGVGYKCRKEV